MVLWSCLIAVIIAVIMDYKLNVNAGIVSMVFAFIIGIFMMGLKVTDVIGFFPVNITFFLIMITLFFAYATENGTMEILGKKIMYAVKGKAILIPIATVLCANVVAFLGAGAATPVIVGPLAFAVGLPAGIHPLIIAACIGFANLIGGDNPFNGYAGIVSRQLIDALKLSDPMGMTYAVWASESFFQIVIIILTYFAFKGFKAKNVDVTGEAPKFNSLQKKTLTVILCAMAIIVIPTLLNSLVKNPTIALLAKFAQPQVVMVIGAVLAAIMKLGDEKKMLRLIPMGPILMIVGVSLLIGVAQKAGFVKMMTDALSQSVSPFWVPAVLVLIAAFLSIFTSAVGVVMPLMYPMVPGIAAATGLDPTMLLACILTGSTASSLCPFSTGGALVIAGCPDEKVKDQLTKQLIPYGMVVVPIICGIFALLGFFGIFK